ncbi:MAG TPA: SPFH domain-containing protein [Blastocatellia bacterium]|nr:SPFH domain-containing protein [Blastocatellia bacterium]
MEYLILLVILVGIVFYIAAKTVRIVPQATVMIIERLGRFDRVATSGLNIVTPFLDRPRALTWSGIKPGTSQIDLREQITDLAPQPVITRDNVTILVDSIIYWQVTDPIKAIYEVSDLVGGIIQLTITAMRNVIGALDLDHALTSRDTINSNLRVVLDEATHKWGVKVTRVELKNINPPEDVRITMEKQMTAERNRRALVLQAEGEKQAAIARAEGEKQSAITRAEGAKQAMILQAEGAAQARLTAASAEAESISRIASSIAGNQGNPAQYLIMMKYIESLQQMAHSSNSKVVFMPVETSSVLSSIGAFKEVFGDVNSGGEPVPAPPPRLRSGQ